MLWHFVANQAGGRRGKFREAVHVRLRASCFNLTSLWCGVYEPIVCYSELGFNKQCVYHVGEMADVP